MTDGLDERDELRIRPEVAQRLGHYVYLLIDPETERPFYVGKGQGERALAHLSERAESRKCEHIARLRAAGKEPRVDILSHGMADAEAAFRVEAAVIDLLGLDALTNEVRGVDSLRFGRVPLTELNVYYGAKPVAVDVPALLIRINRLYRRNMTADELYEATRGVWKLGPRCAKARYAFAVFEGVVREVYEIDAWHDAATTPYATRDATLLNAKGRREFTGHVARDVRDRYVDRSVAAEFRRGLRSPVVYVNCA